MKHSYQKMLSVACVITHKYENHGSVAVYAICTYWGYIWPPVLRAAVRSCIFKPHVIPAWEPEPPGGASPTPDWGTLCTFPRHLTLFHCVSFSPANWGWDEELPHARLLEYLINYYVSFVEYSAWVWFARATVAKHRDVLRHSSGRWQSTVVLAALVASEGCEGSVPCFFL